VVVQVPDSQFTPSLAHAQKSIRKEPSVMGFLIKNLLVDSNEILEATTLTISFAIEGDGIAHLHHVHRYISKAKKKKFMFLPLFLQLRFNNLFTKDSGVHSNGC
jgi:hypothetical protein